MDDIDLTLRKEFLKNSTRRDRFDDTNAYLDKMGHQDQRRAKGDILNESSIYDLLGIRSLKSFVVDAHHDFFTEDRQFGYNELEGAEAILRITNILTNDLRLEYDSGYGREDCCDCCGNFRSPILNSQQYGLCDKCEKDYQLRTMDFWERRNEFITDRWID